MPYFGGKSVHNAYGQGRWIADVLPHDTDTCYVEPWGGMLGVLLQRERSKVEIANDLDRRIVNWWQQVRDNSDTLQRRLAFTPLSRDVFADALKQIDDADPLVSAWAVSVVLTQSLRASLASVPSSWKRWFSPNRERSAKSVLDRLPAVAARLADVQLENIDAVRLLERVAGETRAVVYCDPPYYQQPGADLYGTSVIDVDAMTAALSEQQGRVAVSGYGDEWDHLGWCRSEFDTHRSALGALTDTRAARTEVLWTNYQPTERLLLFEV